MVFRSFQKSKNKVKEKLDIKTHLCYNLFVEEINK